MSAKKNKKAAKEEFNFHLKEYCGLCYQNKRTFIGKGSGSSSNKCIAGHLWKKPLHVGDPNPTSEKIVRNPIWKRKNYMICSHVTKCDYRLQCHYAHNSLEQSVWNWMGSEGIYDLEVIMKNYKLPQVSKVKVSSSSLPAPTGACASSPVSSSSLPAPTGACASSPAPWSNNTPINEPRAYSQSFDDPKHVPYYCKSCCRLVEGERQWDEHLRGKSHKRMMSIMKLRPWSHRPIYGHVIKREDLVLCERFMSQQECGYSLCGKPENECPHAHSEAELDEWKERFDYTRLWLKLDNRFSAEVTQLDDLLEDFEKSQTEALSKNELPDQLTVTCEQALSVPLTDSECRHRWKFRVHMAPGVELNSILLMKHEYRNHFVLCLPQENPDEQAFTSGNYQIFSASKGHFAPSKKRVVNIDVVFNSTVHGSFDQWVVFDCRRRPRYCRALHVDKMPAEKLKKLQAAREMVKVTERWCTETVDFVPFSQEDATSDQRLEIQFGEMDVEEAVSQASIQSQLTCENYISKMRQLLQAEELWRRKEIASFNISQQVQLSSAVQVSERFIPASQGQLFCRIELDKKMTEDTANGHLLFTSVRSAWIAQEPVNRDRPRVFEALLVDMERFGLNGWGADYLYLCLSKRCVQELGWRTDQKVQALLQFQFNRTEFCRMYYALSCVAKTREGRPIIFPNKSLPVQEAAVPPDWASIERDHAGRLNDQQMQILKTIVSKPTPDTPPLVIGGAFGSGKTRTLAQTLIFLLKKRPKAKILVCTHNNSAMEIYMKDYLLCHMVGPHAPKVILVYYDKRRVDQNTDKELLNYALLSENRSSYRRATLEDLQGAQAVITTLQTSFELTQISQIQAGFFDYIFVDEAAQVLETEILIPLALADNETQIVLAGDPKQMRPTIFNPDARAGLQEPILLRLWKMYENTFESRRVLLKTVYRSHPEIVNFLSKAIYKAELIPRNPTDYVPVGWKPLSLYYSYGQGTKSQVMGELSSEDGGWFNEHEAVNVASQVEALVRCPDPKLSSLWGVEDLVGQKMVKDLLDRQMAICVLSPFSQQVKIIRELLRNNGLRFVNVMRMNAIQGRQFQAIFISPVRTRNVFINDTRPLKERSRGEYCADFHHDKAMLNTAISRAKNIVQIVGDPVGLLTVGSGPCISTYRLLVEHCSDKNAIYPLESHINLSGIQQLENNLVAQVQVKFLRNGFVNPAALSST